MPKVICTIRDKESWVASMDAIAKHSKMDLLAWILWPLPTMRYFVPYLESMGNGRWGELYYQDGVGFGDWSGVRDRHMMYLEETVPRDKLFFFNVKDGWTPLCQNTGLQRARRRNLSQLE